MGAEMTDDEDRQAIIDEARANASTASLVELRAATLDRHRRDAFETHDRLRPPSQAAPAGTLPRQQTRDERQAAWHNWFVAMLDSVCEEGSFSAMLGGALAHVRRAMRDHVSDEAAKLRSEISALKTEVKALRRAKAAKRPAEIASWRVESTLFTITPILSSGAEGPTLDVRELFEAYHRHAVAAESNR
jgi:hypothetical protein